MEVKFERRHLPKMDALGKPIVQDGITQIDEYHWAEVTISRNSIVSQKIDDFFFNLEQDTCLLRTPQSDKVLQFFREQYDRWKKGLDPLIDGIPIENWSYLTKGQVEQLKQFGLHTIESLAQHSGDAVNRFIGFSVLQKRAKEYIESLTGPEAVRKRMEEMAAEIAQLREDAKIKENVSRETNDERRKANRDIVIGAPKEVA